MALDFSQNDGMICISQGRECLQVSPWEAVALLAVWQCVEEAATVEELLAEEGPCHEEQLEEE